MHVLGMLGSMVFFFFFEAMYLLFIYSVIDHRFITPLHMYISTHYVKHVHLYVCVYVIHARMYMYAFVHACIKFCSAHGILF